MSRGALLMLCAGLLAACAPETESAPEPQLDTPGSFIAQREGTGKLSLLRSLERLRVENFDTLLFFSVYDVEASTWDEARELAKGPELPLRFELSTAYEAAFITTEFRVVWFRTLTADERDRIH